MVKLLIGVFLLPAFMCEGYVFSIANAGVRILLCLHIAYSAYFLRKMMGVSNVVQEEG